MTFFEIQDIIGSLWPVLISIIGFIAWLARLEYKIQTCIALIKDLKDRVKAIEDKSGEVTELKNLVIAIDSKLSVLVDGYNGK